MFTSVFGTVKGLFDNRFIVSYWAPVFLMVGSLVVVVALDSGVGATAARWETLPGTLQLALVVGGLLGVTVLAYLLQALSGALMELFTGYAFLPPGQFAPERLTALGREFARTREDIRKRLGIESAVWWPRLQLLLPADAREEVASAFAALIALVNLVVAFSVAAVVGAVYLIVRGESLALFGLVLIVQVALAYLCYLAATRQARVYGDAIGAAFDLYRHALLEKLRIAVPTDYRKELHLWRQALNPWFQDGAAPYHYAYLFPAGGTPHRWLKWPFHYDLREGPPAPKPPDETLVRIEVAEVDVTVKEVP